MPSISVGTIAVALPASLVGFQTLLKAADGNAGTVAVGVDDASLTVSGDTTHDGIPLGAGDAVSVSRYKASNTNRIYLRASQASQTVFYYTDIDLVGDGGGGGSSGSVTIGSALPAGTNTIGATQDAGPAWTTAWGIAGVPFNSADASSIVSVTSAPTSGQKLVITDLIVSVGTAMTVTFKCETSGVVIAGPFYLPANTIAQLTPRSKGWKLATADKKLQVIASVSGNITVQAGYFSEA